MSVVVDFVTAPFEMDVDEFEKMGVAQFRANPIAAVANGPVLVVNRDHPSFLAVPIEGGPSGSQTDNAIVNARFAARYELIQRMRGEDWRAKSKNLLRGIRSHDETLAHRSEVLGFAK